jgi:hypothetical protein
MSEPTGSKLTGNAQPPGQERRARVRYPSGLETYCQPGMGQLESFWWTAKVRDISRTGLGLVVQRRFEPGTVLTAELQKAEDDFSCTLRLRVVHANPTEDGSWVLGCLLEDELSEEQLNALL